MPDKTRRIKNKKDIHKTGTLSIEALNIAETGSSLQMSPGPSTILETPKPPVNLSKAATNSKTIVYNNQKFPVWTVHQSIKGFESRDTIYISIDIEAYERNANILTELGIIIHHPPIEKRGISTGVYPIHYIIKEATKYRNGRFVSDHRYEFSYGVSRVVSLKVCQTAFEKILSHYQLLAEENGFRIVMVGHGFSNDLRTLNKHGFKIPHGLGIIDTEYLWKESTNCRFSSLPKILKYLTIPHGLLHNAGNDAFLTLDLCFKLSDVQFRRLWSLEEIDFTKVDVELVKEDKSTFKDCIYLNDALSGVLA